MLDGPLRTLLRYGVAALTFLLAVAVLQVPVARGPANAVLVSFFAVLAAAWYGGLGPGLAVTALVALVSWPTHPSASLLVRHILFVAGGAAISLLVESLHAARRRAEADERRYRSLFEANPQPMWVHDARTQAVLAVNEAATRR